MADARPKQTSDEHSSSGRAKGPSSFSRQYASDPAYRAARAELVTAWVAAHPDYYAAAKARRAERYRTDPAFRELCLARNRAAKARRLNGEPPRPRGRPRKYFSEVDEGRDGAAKEAV